MLQGADNVQRSDSLPLSRFCVNEENLEHAKSLLKDEAGNALDTAMLGQMMNSRLGSSPE